MASDKPHAFRRILTLAVTVSTTLVVCDPPAHGQPRPDPFARVAFMVGRWEGTAEGQPGKGTARREYSKALNGRFIRAVHRAEYHPTEKHPQGEVHEDEGFSASTDRESAWSFVNSTLRAS
jgi:hypothetical protein